MNDLNTKLKYIASLAQEWYAASIGRPFRSAGGQQCVYYLWWETEKVFFPLSTFSLQPNK